jgi:hypothetical protein
MRRKFFCLEWNGRQSVDTSVPIVEEKGAEMG